MTRIAGSEGHTPTWSQSLEKTQANHCPKARIMTKVHTGVRATTNDSTMKKNSGNFAVGWETKCVRSVLERSIVTVAQ